MIFKHLVVWQQSSSKEKTIQAIKKERNTNRNQYENQCVNLCLRKSVVWVKNFVHLFKLKNFNAKAIKYGSKQSHDENLIRKFHSKLMALKYSVTVDRNDFSLVQQKMHFVLTSDTAWGGGWMRTSKASTIKLCIHIYLLSDFAFFAMILLLLVDVWRWKGTRVLFL